MTDHLELILRERKESLRTRMSKMPLPGIEKSAKEYTPRGFLNHIAKEDRITLIAEMKRKSPSAGDIRPEYDVAGIARAYERGGASAISVLTEPSYFGGQVEDVRLARQATTLPILRKDFIFDPYQIFEARAYGADAVLLISEMLAASQLKELARLAMQQGLEPLVEVFSSDAVPATLNTGASLIGINSRNLRTLQMSHESIFLLSKLIPLDRTIVAESGIKTPQDVERLRAIRVASVLVGESLLKQSDLEKAVGALAKAGMV